LGALKFAYTPHLENNSKMRNALLIITCQLVSLHKISVYIISFLSAKTLQNLNYRKAW